MKKFLSVVFSLVCTALLFAESATLESTCSKVAAHPYTTGSFTQSKAVTTKGKTRTLQSSGTFIFGVDGIAWNTKKPFPSSMIVTKSQLIQITADGSETVVDMSTDATFSSVANTLLALFSNDVSLLKAGFNIDFTDAGTTWNMVLTPKTADVSAVMKSLQIAGTTSGNDATIESIVLTESSENTVTYTFTDQSYPKDLSADEKALFRTR